MTGPLKTGRVALVARQDQTAVLRDLFQAAPLRGWDCFIASGCEHAHFLVQMDACDLLLVDESILERASDPCLGWLACRPDVPVLFLARDTPDVILHALRQGVRQWLPRAMVLEHPAMLAAALHHALLGRAAQQSVRQTDDLLRDCRNQITRLVNLLWEAVPAEGRPHWFSQRTMLERLAEEVCRTQRHGTPLTLVLGEVWAADDTAGTGDRRSRNLPPEPFCRWTADRVNRSKRRCDVAGQYGLQGFMLLLPHTPPDGAARYCRRLRSLLEETPAPDSVRQQPLPNGRLLSCFGLASYSSATATPKSLLRHAEEQLDASRSARSLLERRTGAGLEPPAATVPPPSAAPPGRNA